MLDVMDIIIDPEFEGYITPVSKEESGNLKADVIEHGYREPIVVWRGHNILLDGHNRLAIFHENDNLDPPEIVEYSFADREEVKDWMVRNQLGRRNLSPNEASRLRGLLYNSTKRPDGGHGDQKSGDQSDTPIQNTAAEKVAEETGVSVPTVKRDGAYTNALTNIGAINHKAPPDILAGSLKISKGDVIKIGKLPADDIGTAIANVRNGRKWNAGIAKPKKSDDSITVDALGRPIPEHLTEHFETAAAFMSACRILDKFSREAERLTTLPGGQFINVTEVKAAVTTAKYSLSEKRYYTECPRCRGDVDPDCKRCHGFGFLPFSMKGKLSPEELVWLNG